MKVSFCLQNENKYNSVKTQNAVFNRQTPQIATIKYDNSLSFLGNYNSFCITKTSGFLPEKLKSLRIPNLQLIENSNIRGETLSSKKNRRFLPLIYKYGIKNIIDIRDQYTSTNFEEMCKKVGLNYYHIPIDSNNVNDKELIKNLSTLFTVLNNGKTYISCAQGLHRTDIALAINYIFNPQKQKTPPIMYGHFRDLSFKYEDIGRRINSLKREMSNHDILQFGWDSTSNFEDTFQCRKKAFKEFNTSYAINNI